jgi:transposase
MPKKRELTAYQLGELTSLLKSGDYTNVKIGKMLKVSESVVRYHKKRILETGSCEKLPRSGRKRKLSERGVRHLKQLALRHRFMSGESLSKELVSSGEVKVSSKTVRRRLIENNIFARVSKRKPLLSEKNLKARKQFADHHISWSEGEWSKVVWSDESRFEIFGNDKRKKIVNRRVGEEYKLECLTPTVKKGGGGINVWGCFSSKGVGVLHLIKGNDRGIMDQHVYKHLFTHVAMPAAKRLHGNYSDFIFQQDNDPKHCAKSLKDLYARLETQGFKQLQWPSQSPDLNPIEHLWDELDRRIRARTERPTNKENLFTILKEEWSKITPETCKNLVDSMPRRLHSVKKNHGGHTKY